MKQEIPIDSLLESVTADSTRVAQIERGKSIAEIIQDARERSGNLPSRKPTPPEFKELIH